MVENNISKNGHYSEQQGHAIRSTFHDAQRRAEINGQVFSKGELEVVEEAWRKRRSSRRISDTGK